MAERYRTTVTLQVTDLPSTLTVIFVVPALRAVIKPEEETDAIVPEPEEYVAFVVVASSGETIGSSW